MKNKNNEGEVKNPPPAPKSEIPAQMQTGRINIIDLDPLDAEAIAHGKFMEDTLNGC